jgi:hypothetical protein
MLRQLDSGSEPFEELETEISLEQAQLVTDCAARQAHLLCRF